MNFSEFKKRKGQITAGMLTIVGLLFSSVVGLAYKSFDNASVALQTANDAKIQSAVLLEKINNIDAKINELGLRQGIHFASSTYR